MGLTRAERERIVDNRMKIRSVANSLQHINPEKIEDYQAIQECLEDADRNLGGALEESDQPANPKPN
jgi:hypothetical protein